jgi:hypothetical protein
MRNRGGQQAIFWMRMPVVCYFLFVLFSCVSLAYGDVGKGKKKSSIHYVGPYMSKTIVRREIFPTFYQHMVELVFLINEQQP